MTPIDKVRAALAWYADFNSSCADLLRELDGMVIVPVEPTDEILDAMDNAECYGKVAEYRAIIAPYLPEEMK